MTSTTPQPTRESGAITRTVVTVAVLVLAAAAAIVLRLHFSAESGAAKPPVKLSIIDDRARGCSGVRVTLGGHSGTTGHDGAVTLPAPPIVGDNIAKLALPDGSVTTRTIETMSGPFNDITVGLVNDRVC